MEQPYPKQYSTPTALVQLLKQRGLDITDEKKAAEYIQNIGYFRLSAYFYPFLKVPKDLHQFKSDSSFDKVMKLYRFDRKLRMLMFNEIGNKEYAFRSRTMNKMNRPWINATVNQQRIFYNLSIIKYFLDIISPTNHFRQRIIDLLVEFPIVDKAAMGFPENWEQEALWLK